MIVIEGEDDEEDEEKDYDEEDEEKDDNEEEATSVRGFDYSILNSSSPMVCDC